MQHAYCRRHCVVLVARRIRGSRVSSKGVFFDAAES